MSKKMLYLLSLSTWLFNIVALFVNLFFNIKAVSMIIIVLSLLIQFILMLLQRKNMGKVKAFSPSLFDKVLLCCFLLALLLSLVGGISGMLAEGNPEYRNGVYCLVDHNEIVQTVSYGVYLYLVICNHIVMFCSVLIVSTFMLIISRLLKGENVE